MEPTKERRFILLNIILATLLILGLFLTYDLTRDKIDDVGVSVSELPGCGPMDSNDDGKLDLIDFSNFARVFNRNCPEVDIQTASFPECGYNDTNLDGKVAIIDFASFGKRYGAESCIQDKLPDNGLSQTIEGFKFTASYAGGNVWNYTITGNMSDGCMSAEEEASFSNNKFLLKLIVSQPEAGSDILCPQVIVPINIPGSITIPEEVEAENIDVEFQVRREYFNSINPPVKKTEEINGHAFQAEYKDTNTWEYSISGQLPNGCYSAGKNSSVVNNEMTITLLLTVTTDLGCTQATIPYTLAGNVSAPDNVIVNFEIETISVTGNNNSQAQTVTPSDGIVSIDKSGLVFDAVHTGSNDWLFIITGEISDCQNPGITVTNSSENGVSVVNATIQLTRKAGTENRNDCTTAKKELLLSGNHTAPGSAVFRFVVNSTGI